MRTTSRPALAALAAGLALALAGCGADDAPAAAATATATAVSPVPALQVAAEHGPADVDFVTGMHPHHQGALEMAELAATRAGSDEVRELAARIAAAQGPENAELEAMADAWRTPLPSGGGHGQHGAGDVEALEGLRGEEFDREFLVRMVAHHESALPMAQAELAGGENPQARALAQRILEVQQAEVAEMRELLAEA